MATVNGCGLCIDCGATRCLLHGHTTHALPVVVEALHTNAVARTGRVRDELGAPRVALIRLQG